MEKKECKHNWEYGYVADMIIYCTKCNREADDVYTESDFSYQTHKCENGQIVHKEQALPLGLRSLPCSDPSCLHSLGIDE
jgi:hypothetical protein